MFRTRMLNRMSFLLNVLLLSMLLIYDVRALESHEMRNNSATAIPVSKRERSAMISNNLDSIKVIADSDKEKSSTWSSRKFDVARSRSILNSQRRLQNRWPNEDCQRRCKNNNVDDICRLKCRFDKRKMENEYNKTTNTLSDGEILITLREKEETLDTAASVQVLLSTDNDFHNKSYESEEAGIKEIFNMINDKEKLHKDSKEQQTFESSTKLSTTGKVNRRKYTRTSVLPLNQTKPTIYRGRVRYSQSSILRAKIENSDTISELSSTFSNKKSSIQSTTPLISKNDKIEIMGRSVSKQSSTEKNIFWKTRNIIAINHYMRKLNPHLVSTDSKFLNTKLPTRSLKIVHDDALKPNEENRIMQNVTQAIPTKIIYNRSASTPSNETPVFFADDRHYQQSDGDFENSKTIHATTLETPTTQIIKILTQSYAPISTNIGNHSKFINKTLTVLKNAEELILTTEKNIKTTSSTFLTPTISTFLNNVSLKNKTNYMNKSLSFITKSTLTTTPMTNYIEEAKTIIPDIIEEVVQPSPKSFMTTTANQLHELQYEGISTTSKSVASDVYVEAQNFTVPIYSLAGAVLILLIIVVPIVVRQYIFKHKKKNDDIENYSNDIQPISPVVKMNHSEDELSTDDGDDSVICEKLEFNRKKLKFKSLLGEGNFGQVWKAEIEDQTDQTDCSTLKVNVVAVKTERLNNGQGGLKAECEIMRKLLPAHPNVVTILAACVEQEPHLVIMSYEMRGKLLSLLRTARGVLNNGNLYNMPNDRENREPVIPLSPRKLTGFAYDIAKGMEYIAGKMIVHGDIAARNVLVDHNGYCKICDFGMSIDLENKKQNQIKIPRVNTYQNPFKFEMTTRIFGDIKNYAISKTRSDNCRTKNRPALPIRWMSPESLQFHTFSHESDVYAFGIVLWEITTLGITPYPTLTGREVIRGVIRDNIRPEIPSKCKQEMSQIMSQCWLKNPAERPHFSEIRKNLARTLNHWEEEVSTNQSEYLDVSGFSEDYENGMIYFNRRVSEFECEI